MKSVAHHSLCPFIGASALRHRRAKFCRSGSARVFRRQHDLLRATCAAGALCASAISAFQKGGATCLK